MDLAVSNFKRIETAEVTIDGFTLIVGASSGGKSTMIKGLKAVLSNQTTDRQYRYGTNGFRYEMNLDGHRLVYIREGKGNRRLEYTAPGAAEPEKISKLDRDSLADIVPAFPLKQIRTKDAVFFPNIVSQGQLPLFSQIAPTELFALLYEDVSKVTTRLDRLKKELLASNKGVSELEAQIKLTEQTELAISQELAKLDVAAIEQFAPILEKFLQDQSQLAALESQFSQEASRLSQFPLQLATERLAPELVASPARFRQFMNCATAVDRIGTITAQVDQINLQRSRFQGLPEDSAVQEATSRLSQAKGPLLSLEKAHQAMGDLPPDVRVAELPEGVVSQIPATLSRLKQGASLLARFSGIQIEAAAVLARVHELAGVEEALDRVQKVKEHLSLEVAITNAEEEIAGVVSSVTQVLSELSGFDHCPLCGAESDLKKVFTHVH